MRHERDRLKIGPLRVYLEPTLEEEMLERIGRWLEVFEDFCIVGQSFREGIDLAVEVTPRSAPAIATG